MSLSTATKENRLRALIPEDQLQARIAELGKEIREAYGDRNGCRRQHGRRL